jgi:thiamine-monophosphate kinase
MSDAGELAFHERLAARLPAVGDDCAVLDGGRLVCTDLLVEGVHFRSAWASPADVGFKALAVNLSDIAAMGGVPEAAVAAVALPAGRPGLAEALLEGLLACADLFGCPLVGGDTSKGPDLFVAVTVTGRAEQPVLRSGALTEETLFVTGPLGGAAAVLERLDAGETVDDPSPLHRPLPRLREGQAAAAAGATAMLDLSDGLAVDLHRLADSSGVGITIDPDRIPVADGATLEQAVGGGDDYELCFTAPDVDRVRSTFEQAGLPVPVVIGRTTDGDGAKLADQPLTGGWCHDIG